MTSPLHHGPQLVMVRPQLDDLPDLSPPSPFSVHAFRPGDEAAWNRIVSDSFGRNADFEREIRQREPYHPDRIMFADVDCEPVATASAWNRKDDGPERGNLHMVGRRSLPAAKGAGYWASLGALWRLRREGRRDVLLQTDDFRLPAIVTYLRLGFIPHIVHPNQPDRWRAVFAEFHGLEPSEAILRALERPAPEAGPVQT